MFPPCIPNISIPVSGRISFPWVLLPFRTKVPADRGNYFQSSLYFSFLSVKQRDFPGNVRSRGCDSLPLVVAFTRKQHDSPCSYALRFLCITSHQMCCAGERAECHSRQSGVKISLHSWLSVGKAFLEESRQICFLFTSDLKNNKDKSALF